LACRQALGSDVPLKLSFVLKLSESIWKFKSVAGQWKGIVSPNPQRALVFPLQVLALRATE
jgi:hypothetical protein